VSTDEQSQQESPSLPRGADDEPTAPAVVVGPKYPLLLYTLARLGLLIVVGAVLYLAGARTWLLVILAFLISGLLSYVVLGRLRDGVSAKVATRIDASRERRAAASDAEDDLY
jgi:hypothetical protein